ncbi:MAG: hypothetical protein HBSAPP03_07580 [Phycisphaerae bacterium]|nr:MAG: hypothetical protein HBSAPP03_07580 [Phycisphaerae bacterium]
MRIIAIACACLTTTAGAQPFSLVGVAPGQAGSRAYALSNDGSRAAGSSLGGNAPGFVWSATDGRYDFGYESGLPQVTRGFGLSGDGSTVVGDAYTIGVSSPQAYRWRGPGTFETLGLLAPYPQSTALDASFDGSVVVGRADADASGSPSGAFRWTAATGMVDLGRVRPTHFNVRAQAVSDDGNVIVGTSSDFDTFDAFIWTSTLGMQALPQFANEPNATYGANGMNGTGSIVVGQWNQNQNGSRMAMWRDGQIFDLGRPTGFTAVARAVNTDGTVVVGTLSGTTAGIWTPERGPETLAAYLAYHSIAVPAGVNLVEARAVSADGRTIDGWTGGAVSQGFVVTIPSPGTTMLFLGVLAGVGHGRRRPNALAPMDA